MSGGRRLVIVLPAFIRGSVTRIHTSDLSLTSSVSVSAWFHSYGWLHSDREYSVAYPLILLGLGTPAERRVPELDPLPATHEMDDAS